MKTKHIVISLLSAIVLAGCEKELPVYDYQVNSLNFDVTLDEETGEAVEKNYSFVYSGNDVMTDTIWVTVNTQGFLADTDRPFELQQVKALRSDTSLVDTAYSNAVPDVHYKDFNDEDFKKRYLFIPARQNTQKFPVVVMRDASLSKEDVRLYLQIKPNGHFDQGLIPLRTMKIVISNNYKKPAGWVDYYFGAYGPVKHKFMIDETGLRWDDEFCTNLTDFGYIQYLTMSLYQRLQEVNAERKKQGLDVLKEEDGRAVKFDFGASF